MTKSLILLRICSASLTDCMTLTDCTKHLYLYIFLHISPRAFDHAYVMRNFEPHESQSHC